MTKLS